MAFIAQYSRTVAALDQQVEAWLLSPLLILLFLVILIKTLLELPLFYVGSLLLVVALTLRKRLPIPFGTTCQKATVKVEYKAKKEGDRNLLSSMPSFIILFGAVAVIFEIVSVSPNAATDAYKTVQAFTDPKHDEGDPLSINQRAIVDRYSAAYAKIQLSGLEEDERFVAAQIIKHEGDRRWLYVQSVLQHFAYAYAPKTSQKQISQRFLALWRQLEEEVKTRAAEKPAPTPD